MTTTEYSFTKIFWKKLRRNKGAVFGLCIIVLALLLAVFAYVVAPDSTPDANRIIVELAAKKPGYEQQFIKIDKEQQTTSSFFNEFLFGKEDRYQYIPITSYKQTGNRYDVEKFVDEGVTEPLSFTFNNNNNPNRIVTKTFWLGTDKFGRDILSRLIVGVRISLSVGLIAVAISLTVGIFLGAVAGYFRGWVDDVILWLINVVWSIPTLLLVFAITLALGKGFWQVFLAVGLTLCDLLHAHSPAICGAAAARVAKRRGIPLVYEIRAFWEDAAVGNGTGTEGSLKYKLIRGLEDRVVAKADAVVTICEGLRGDLVARGVDPAKLSIMPNGVDLELFGNPIARDPALAAQLGLLDGPIIGFIGSFYDYEGIDDLIAAMPALIAKQPKANLMLVGGGPVEAALRAQAEASPAASAIRFVGRVPHHEVERYYALVDVMAYPRKASRLTDLVTPLKPLEAMAQGKLVAASNVGGHRELMTDGVTGTLFAPDDRAACAAALADLLADRSNWDARRAAALAHVRDNHDWARNAHRYQDVYQRLLTRSLERSASRAA